MLAPRWIAVTFRGVTEQIEWPGAHRRAKPTPGTSADRRFWREARRTCRAFSRSRAAAMRLRAGRLDLAEAAEEAAYARWVWPE